MKKVLMLIITLVSVIVFARGGGYSSGGGRSGGYSSSSSRSGGYSSSNKSSVSTRSSGYSKSTSYSATQGYSAKQSTQIYIYHNYVPSYGPYFWHPIFGFGYYHSNMSFFEMYMWHQILFPHMYEPRYYEHGACEKDADCNIQYKCDLTRSPGLCVVR